MTNSLYENIQALGNRMVSNLTAKGVSAQFSDGGLTLADKILDINAFNDGVFLASDKKIAQSSNTVHLSAMVVDDGMFKVGEPVTIEDRVNTTPMYTKTKINADPENPDTIGDTMAQGHWGLVFGSYSGSADAPFVQVYNEASSPEWLWIEKTSTGFDITSDKFNEMGTWTTISLTGTILYCYDGFLFTDTGDKKELSLFIDFEFDYIGCVEGTVSFYRIYGGGITGNSGAVSGIYTCSGAGKKEIVAKSGSVVSEPYEVLDCVVYDSCTLADSTKTTFDALSSASVFTRYDDYGALTEKNTGTTATLSLSSLSSPCTVDFELCGVDGSASNVSMDLYNSGSYKSFVTLANLGYSDTIIGQWVKLRMTLADGTVTVTSLDDPTKTVTKTFTGTVNNIRWSTGGGNTEIRFKDLKVY